MLRLMIGLAFLFCLSNVRGQVGVHTFYSSYDAIGLSRAPLVQTDHTETGIGFGLDYWFRLKQKRIEFLPTIYYINYGGDHKIQNYGFQFRATIYPFDLAGDCNCPTFSKENELLKKGFFLRLSPGIGIIKADADPNISHEELGEIDNVVPEISFGAGLDIGISNLITITPELRYRYIFPSEHYGPANNRVRMGDVRMFEPALRVGFRFDEKNYGFKRPRRRRR